MGDAAYEILSEPKHCRSTQYLEGYTNDAKYKKPEVYPRTSCFLSTLCWRLPTLPLRVPSALEGLTAVFGMRTGVPPPMKHQHRELKLSALVALNKTHFKLESNFYAFRRIPFESSDRRISTPRLNTLRCLHLAPINVVISHEPQTIPYLGVGFPLRCFQRLSVPDIATGRCSWYYSPQTRGQSISVLSY